MDNNDKIVISYHSPSYLKVQAPDSIIMELSEHFSFMVDNFEILKKKVKKLKFWDGKIRIFKQTDKLLYFGLYEDIEKFAKERHYDIEINDEDKHIFNTNSFSIKEAEDFIKTLNLPFEVREYQIETFVKAVRNKRRVFLSPTSSGKSLIIYLITKYYLDILQINKFLIIVPDVTLVHQMADDFVSYGCEETRIHKIYAGEKRYTEKDIVITTWQSINSETKQATNYEWVEQFDSIIVDEAHSIKERNIITDLMTQSTANVRFGFTATLDDLAVNKMVIKGIIGPIDQVTTIKKLIKDNHISNLLIKPIILNYPEFNKKHLKNKSYNEEISYLIKNQKRNDFIINLALSLKGNTIIFYRYVEEHGKKLFESIKTKTDRPVYFYAGEIDGEERNDIRKKINEESNALWVVSSGTGSTGVNVPNIHNIIFTHSFKKLGKVLQSLGRGLRKHESKDLLLVFDIVDDLSYNGEDNYTLSHFKDRLTMYINEELPYKLYNVNLYS